MLLLLYEYGASGIRLVEYLIFSIVSTNFAVAIFKFNNCEEGD
jgi:hypothetical protein